MEKIKAEFHIHTKYSQDSILNKYFILLMCKLKKINLIAITDHNEIEGAIKYQKYFSKKGIEVIVGEEILTSDGEIIGLYLKDKIAPGLSVEETIKLIKKQEGIVYLPHPYDEKRNKTVLELQKQNKNKNKIDLIEIHNGRNVLEEYSSKQKKIQEELGIVPVIGSDAHTFFEIGRNYIIMERPTRNTLIKNISKGEFVSKKCVKLSHSITKFVKIIKLVGKGEMNELYRIVKRKCTRKLKRIIKKN